ncbi:hypothetical protein ABLU07_15345, partial [Acinetobacter radioresistens]|uniref:hypothetical protein n=1 Tax=Acinetobacter radioresistens TaxID=40216 RepID=UPI0032B3F241
DDVVGQAPAAVAIVDGLVGAAVNADFNPGCWVIHRAAQARGGVIAQQRIQADLRCGDVCINRRAGRG